jgi:RimJ/RimL family protein N-acetyltransferase
LPILSLEEATEDDLPLLMAWRSNPLVYQGFYQQKDSLTWEEHIEWWKSRNRDWRTFIIIYGNRPVGVITIGQLDHWSPEIGYYIGEVSLWGKGLGREAVRLALNWLRKYGKSYCHTTVLNNNKRSIKLLKSFGFKYFGKARKGESWYQVELS